MAVFKKNQCSSAGSSVCSFEIVWMRLQNDIFVEESHIRSPTPGSELNVTILRQKIMVCSFCICSIRVKWKIKDLKKIFLCRSFKNYNTMTIGLIKYVRYPACLIMYSRIREKCNQLTADQCKHLPGLTMLHLNPYKRHNIDESGETWNLIH